MNRAEEPATETQPAKRPSIWQYCVGFAMGLAAMICFFVSFFADPQKRPSWASILLALWFVVPPIYFFFEFHYVRRNYPARIDHLKESQASAEKVWAGVAAALAVLYFKS
jgi:hypothetical protein